MPTRSPRGARRAAPLALVLGVACTGLIGCSGADSTAAPAGTAAPSASSSSDPRVAAVLTKAKATLVAERSFRFDAVETVAATKPSTTHVAGRVVRNQGVAYTLTVGPTTTQVVRIKSATYVRKVPGSWAKLAKARPVADPSGTLTAILDGLADGHITSFTTSDAGSTASIAGTLPDAAAKSAGIPVGGQPAQVTVDVDGAGHVTRVTVHTVTQAGTSAVTVTLITSYSAFDRVPALRAPR